MATNTVPQPSNPDVGPQPPQAPDNHANAGKLYEYYYEGGKEMSDKQCETVAADLALWLEDLKDPSTNQLPGEVSSSLALHVESLAAIGQNTKNKKVRVAAEKAKYSETLEALLQTNPRVDRESVQQNVEGALERLAILPLGKIEGVVAEIIQKEGDGTFDKAMLEKPEAGVDDVLVDNYKDVKERYIKLKAQVDAPDIRRKLNIRNRLKGSGIKQRLAFFEEELRLATAEMTAALLNESNPDIKGDRKTRAAYFLNKESLSIAVAERQELRNRSRTVRSAENKAEMSKKKKVYRAIGQAAIAGGLVFTAGLTGGAVVLAAIPAVRAVRGMDMMSTRLSQYYGKFDLPKLMTVIDDNPSADKLAVEFIQQGRERSEEARKAYRKAAIISVGVTAVGIGLGEYARLAADMGWGFNPVKDIGNHLGLMGNHGGGGHADSLVHNDPTRPVDSNTNIFGYKNPSAMPSPTATHPHAGVSPSHVTKPIHHASSHAPHGSETPSTAETTPSVDPSKGALDIDKLSSSVSHSGETISNNEGFYHTMDSIYGKVPQLQGMNQHDYYQIHLRVGAKLEHMKFPNGEPMAYRVHDAHGNLYYGFGSTGKLSPEAVKMFLEEGAKQKGFEASGSNLPHSGLMENVQFSHAAEVVGHGENVAGQVKDIAPQLHELGINAGDKDYAQIVNKIGGVFEKHGLARYTGSPSSHLEMIQGKHIPDSVLREAVQTAAQSRGIDLASLHGVIEQTNALDLDNFYSKAVEAIPAHASGEKLSHALGNIPQIKELGINTSDSATLNKLGEALHASHPQLLKKSGNDWVFTSAGKLNKDSFADILSAAAKAKGTTIKNLFTLAA
ncbi:MAG TPA: hypothetical protein VLF60_01880 [Candidatus Saccharimonadales bacterium]|nr:hypothetical protein [Candidatus Saccharimonadales bacterium]